MEIKDFSDEIISAIGNVLPKKSKDSPIGLHEPYFKDTKAIDYLKDCIDTTWVSSNGSWVRKFEEKLCE